MKKKGIKFIPVIYLGGIDIKNLNELYEKGNLDKIEKPDVDIVDNKLTGSEKKIGTDKYCSAYYSKDRYMSKELIVSDNDPLFNWAMIDGKSDSKVPDTTCGWCRMNIDKNILGVPVSVEKHEGIDYYFMYESYCSFGCMYAHFLDSKRFNSVIFAESEYLIFKLFNELHPTKRLIPRGYWRLLKNNGGSISEKEFFSQRLRFRETGNIVMYPCKFQYVQVRSEVEKLV